MAAVAMEAGPAPVGIDEVKALLRVEGSAEDALIAGFIRAAAATCEAFCGCALIAREAGETLTASREWRRLPLSPVRSIDGLEAAGAGGEAALLPPDAYAIDVDADGDGWVRVLRDVGAGQVLVRYQVGMAADWNGVPEPLRQGIVRLAAHFYAHRGESEAPPPTSVAALWRPWRRIRIG